VGQHFFFDMGQGQCLAFFWLTDAPERSPGYSNPRKIVDPEAYGDDLTAWMSSHGSMNHLAFDVPADQIEDYRDRLMAKGITVSPVFHHDNSPQQMSAKLTNEVFVSSIYFMDPDGVMLEFASWQREVSKEMGDRNDHVPATPADKEAYRLKGEEFAKLMAQQAGE